MIIGVDGNEANIIKRVGVSVYTLNLLKYFKKKANAYTQFIIYLRTHPLLDLPSESKFFTYKIVKGSFLWSQIFLPFYLYINKGINVFFSPAHYTPRACPVPTVVTIHDLAFLYYPNEFLKKDLYQLTHWTKTSVNQAKTIIAVSKTTKNDIIKSYGINEQKIQVVYNGYEKAVKNPPPTWKSTIKVKNPTILYVGTLQPRKNISILIQAFEKFKMIYPEYKLILTGKKGWMYSQLFDEVQEKGLLNDVFFSDYISDLQLMFLYKHSSCFVLPSKYEGFGIPILEAMSHECPVIASFSSSLPEVGGDACLYFDPNNPHDLFEKLKMLHKDEVLRKELIKKGMERIKEFSWEKCCKETLEIIKNSARE